MWAVDSKVVLALPANQTLNIPKFNTATTLTHVVLSHNIHELEFETQIPINFKSGQFISVKVSDQRINAYSIAGSKDPNHFGLLTDVSPQGVGSKYFENLKVGEKITFLGPVGAFALKPEDGSRQLLFLGTGCGVVPLKFMIEDALINKKISQPITLYFGLRFKEDIFWQDIFDNLAKTYSNFHFKLCLSQPTEGWTGFRGHITDLVRQDFPNASECSAYLCGNKIMVEESSNILLSSNCPVERIYSEKFN